MITVTFFWAVVGVVLAKFLRAPAIVFVAVLVTFFTIALGIAGYMSFRRALICLAMSQIGLQGGALLGFFVKHLLIASHVIILRIRRA